VIIVVGIVSRSMIGKRRDMFTVVDGRDSKSVGIVARHGPGKGMSLLRSRIG
jgi:hypothetical protein